MPSLEEAKTGTEIEFTEEYYLSVSSLTYV